MNSTMIRKFCTLKEAAERLDVTEDQIEKLLRKGLLREFREGAHRLLRTSDIGAIVAARNRRLERQGQPLTKPTRSPAPGQTSEPRLPRPAGVASQRTDRETVRPGTTAGIRHDREPGPGFPTRRPISARTGEPPRLSDRSYASRSRIRPQVQPPRPSLSIREWFWMGLIQDRPVAIALLSGLILLVLSAMIAGIYTLTRSF